MTASSLDPSLVPRPWITTGSGPAAPAHASTAGPGWFESSWDLRRGLEVRESGEADARLRTWIEEFLGGQLGASSRAAGTSPGAAGASFSAT